MKIGLKQKATQLRREGWSLNIIASRLGVAKSTLSHWLKEIPYTPNDETKKRIKAGPAKSGMLRHNITLKSIQIIKKQAAQEIEKISKRDLWMLGLGLYIGEGSKIYETIRIINSDPEVIKLAMSWFRNICKLTNKNFTLAIHIYPDTPKKATLLFWSKVTKIPLKQFGQTQIDHRRNKSKKKRRKLVYGTAHITIKSGGNKSFGVILHRRIIGWIEEIYKQIAGIV